MRNVLSALAAVMFVLGLAGCGTQSGEPEPDPGPAPESVQETSSDDAEHDDAEHEDVVRIGLTDWTIETGEVTLPAGEVTIVVTNAGGTEHDLLIRGSHGTWGTPYLAPGETYELQITTQSGETLELECTVAGHRSAGMHTQLRVDDGGAV